MSRGYAVDRGAGEGHGRAVPEARVCWMRLARALMTRQSDGSAWRAQWIRPKNASAWRALRRPLTERELEEIFERLRPHKISNDEEQDG